ncbi:MAG: glycosyltransferase family 2 protein [Deltaproteobacteria bacterium]|nr:glycosyltransferase family 2 protein [Deltaproteobacteria bacterium]
MIISLILWFNYLVLAYYFAANGIYLVLLILASGTILSHLSRLEYARYQGAMHDSVAPPVSVIVAAYNEEANIIDSVRSLLKLDYPDFEIIVVNDGSNDGTLSKLIEGFGLKRANVIYRQALRTSRVHGFYLGEAAPRLVVVDKAHAGKADSLNVGINVSRAPYFCSVDADSVLEEKALLRLMRPIIEAPDLVHATGGIVRLVNGSSVADGRLVDIRLPKDSLSLIQVVEYIRSFLFGRAGLSVLNSLLVISGTFSMFQKKSVLAAGGYKTNMVTEDMELVVRLHKHLRDHKRKYRITFVPDPICWTEAPKDLAMLKKQRSRWHTGLAASIYMYKSMLFNYRYGRIGFFALPYQLLVELIGPVIEVAGYVVVTASFAFGIVDRHFFMLFVVMAILVGIFFSIAAVLLEEISYRRYPKFRDTFKLLAYSVLENFGYRQMLSLWRTQAVLKFLFSRNQKWEVVRKRGFSKPAKEA